ncbi:MAG: trigger factor [Candidatus Eisenbacteria bacterium]|nr:trigger factor [Candidatus Latescibacterota bacterium]MBD3301294.1 trigger factor [Candidatus Eisenbacteria bacterium]
MQVQVTDKGDWKRQMAVTIPTERVERAMEGIVRSYRKKAALPGFRRGKAPTEVIKVRFQGDLESDLLNELIPDAFEEALKEQEMQSIGPPRFHSIRFRSGEPLSFLVDFEVWPRPRIEGYEGLKIEQESIEIDEQMVDEAVESLRRNHAALVPVERPAREGDVVQALLEPIDVHGKRLPKGKREEVRMEAGSPNLLPEFQEASLGIEAGQERKLEVRYPEGFGDANLAGKTRRFRMIAKEIDEKKLPEPDDEFARGIDPNLDLEGLRAKLRLRLESEELVRSKQRLEEKLIDRLLEMNRFPVPEGLMQYSLAKIADRARQEGSPLSAEDLEQRYRPVLERMHRRDLLIDNVARQESIEVTDEELEAELESMAEEAGVEVGILRKKMESEGEVGRVRETLHERKVIDFLVASAEVTRTRRPRPATEQAPPEGSGEREQKGRIILP